MSNVYGKTLVLDTSDFQKMKATVQVRDEAKFMDKNPLPKIYPARAD